MTQPPHPDRLDLAYQTGREVVGMSVGIPKCQADKPAGPKDELDTLMDSLDALEL